jgi:hypothetical protein
MAAEHPVRPEADVLHVPGLAADDVHLLLRLSSFRGAEGPKEGSTPGQALGLLGQSGPEVPVRRSEGVQREQAGRCGEDRHQAVDTRHFHRGRLQRHKGLPSAQGPAGLPARLGEDKTEACGNLP